MNDEFLVETLRSWWFEIAGTGLAIVVGTFAALRGEFTHGFLAAVLLVAFVDRVRLRLDNRSLTAQVRTLQSRVREETGDDPTAN